MYYYIDMNISAQVASPSFRLLAFGAQADAYAHAIHAYAAAELAALSSEIIICDGDRAQEAFAAALRAKRAGKPVTVAPLLPSRELALAQWISGYAVTYLTDPDELRMAFEAITTSACQIQHPQIDEFEADFARRTAALQQLVTLSDGLIVRSQTERERLARALGIRSTTVHLCAPPDASLPPITARAGGKEIVVWAPDKTTNELGQFLYAFKHMQNPPIFVCRDAIAGTPYRFLTRDEAPLALSEAAVIIDTDVHNPAVARGFAGRGFGLCAAISSGAHEYLDGLNTYRANDFTTILGAASRARADRRTTAIPQFAQYERPASYSPNRSQSRISLLLPAVDDARALIDFLQALDAQSHRAFEILVADRGEFGQLPDVLRHFPAARAVAVPHSDLNTSVGCLQGQATGEYFAIVDPRMRFFPQLFSRMLEVAYQPQAAVFAPTLCSVGIDSIPIRGEQRNYHFHTSLTDPGHALPFVLRHCSHDARMPVDQSDVIILAGIFIEIMPAEMVSHQYHTAAGMEHRTMLEAR